jgi:2-polyprenyl-6-methoxyphenol hydroxylase-like FAD-dependent oxidoreductase
MIDVLIVGAGPTGLMLAILLQRLGMSFRIIEQNEGPAKESRALGVQARTMELFHKLGLVEEFLARGLKARGANIFLNGKERMKVDLSDMARDDTLYPYIFFIPQNETEKILLNRVRNVERRTRLLSFEDRDEYVESKVENVSGHETIFSRFLCGCDGSHSVVRKTLGLDFEGGAYDANFLMADAKVHWQRPYDELHVFLERGKLAVFFPLKSADLSRVFTISEREGNGPKTIETTAYRASLKQLQKEFKKASHMEVPLSDPEWVTRYHVHHRSVDRMRVGNVMLLGDAAHIHSPIGAQGMNTGLQDANNLAWKLKFSIAHPELKEELLESFNQERLPIAKKLLNFTDHIFNIVITKNPLLISARNLVLPALTKMMMGFPQGKRMLFNFVSQLNIHYHPNRVVAKGAGERARNLKLREGSLHDHLVGYDFHVLAFKQSEWSRDEKETFRFQMNEHGFTYVHFFSYDEDTKSIFECYEVKDEGYFVIRPDGHIGFKTESLAAKIDYPSFDNFLPGEDDPDILYSIEI